MGNKTLFIATANTVPTANDKFTFGNAEDTLQLQSCRVTDLKAGMGVDIFLEAFTAATAVSTGEKAVCFTVPASMNGYNLTAVLVSVDDKGITGQTDVTIVKETAGAAADMLSTEVILEDVFFAANGVIDATEDDVATGDNISVNVDAIHSGTAPNGLFVTLTFSL